MSSSEMRRHMDDPVSPLDVALSRRGLIALAAGAPLLVVGLAAAAHAEDAPPVCVNLDTLPASQKGMRRSIGFKLQSPDPKKHCGICTFFTGSAGGCGKCQLLSGGAVAVTSLCDSFAARA
jgi:hypothetical protein